ncbi:hypothetical protein [Burkholderia cepacia]|uniref:hypothetical protein n=1 Tax=Burkholderia cepacia TaxID=292 RepID=UPI001CF120A1|nr:hypothetical protein [Burkholderia cepacia]MCA8079934.1 hypothetical protein [Burkholderia cepacia]
MKRLYARLLLWLLKPMVDVQRQEAAAMNAGFCSLIHANDRSMLDLSRRLDAAHSACVANACAIAAEQAARQSADAALQARFTAQSREF